MTREEAIAKLKEKRQIFIDEWADLDDIVEAFDMAISALSAEPSDLISRADAIEAVCNAMCEEDAPYYPECDQKQYCLEIQALKALPSADAEQTETSTFGEKHQLSHGRLIDADELKKHLDGAWEELNDDGERKGVRLARWYLISAPTVDSTIDVVRCKDCEYYKCCEVFNPKKITENDFCSWAKMKGGAK